MRRITKAKKYGLLPRSSELAPLDQDDDDDDEDMTLYEAGGRK